MTDINAENVVLSAPDVNKNTAIESITVSSSEEKKDIPQNNEIVSRSKTNTGSLLSFSADMDDDLPLLFPEEHHEDDEIEQPVVNIEQSSEDELGIFKRDSQPEPELFSPVGTIRVSEGTLFEKILKGRSQETFILPRSIGSPSQTSQESIVIESIIEPTIDRNMYYELHKLYTNKLRELKKRNIFLQTKMAEYYLRRKTYHALLGDDKHAVHADEQKRYDKMLDELDAKHDTCSREQQELENEIFLLRHKRASQKEEVNTLTNQLTAQEYNLSKVVAGAADDKGKAAVEKFVERHVKHQKHEIDLLSKLRLKYIKLRNKYNEVQEKLDTINQIGSHLRLFDYEQLKDDNRTLCDKLEEKELILTTIRKQCKHLMQILAHTREKLSAINLDIGTFNQRLEAVSDDCVDIREQLTAYKLERDELRRDIRRIKDSTGLLGKPKLLRDMETTLKEIEQGKAMLEQYKCGIQVATHCIKSLRNQHSENDLLVFIDEYKLRKRRQRNA